MLFHILTVTRYTNKNKLTREEVLTQKREAERLRYLRIKSDPEKWKELQMKDHFKYLKRKLRGS